MSKFTGRWSRRRFMQGAGLAGLGLLGGCGPLPGQSPPAPRTYRVARLGPNEGTAFDAALHDLGYTEGQNLVVDFRRSQGLNDPFQQLASELLERQPDVFLTGGTLATRAAIAVS